MNRRTYGFTVIELVFVIVVPGIIAAVFTKMPHTATKHNAEHSSKNY